MERWIGDFPHLTKLECEKMAKGPLIADRDKSVFFKIAMVASCFTSVLLQYDQGTSHWRFAVLRTLRSPLNSLWPWSCCRRSLRVAGWVLSTRERTGGGARERLPLTRLTTTCDDWWKRNHGRKRVVLFDRPNLVSREVGYLPYYLRALSYRNWHNLSSSNRSAFAFHGCDITRYVIRVAGERNPSRGLLPVQQFFSKELNWE